MPFTDPVSSLSASGRNSRASNVSGVTGASRSIRSQPTAAAAPNDTLASAGVLSMLKTSTDTGDIGALSFNNARLPTMPRAAHPRQGHNPRLSGSSKPATGTSSHHHYAPSQTSRVSSTREWDSQRRGSFTSMQSMPPSLPPVHLGKEHLHMPPLLPNGARDSRSFSMTSAPATQQLPRHRSAASLKSQGHEPRHPPHLRPGHQPPPMPENRPPYAYPTRLKRPGYRSPSPALSDTYAQGPPPAMPSMAGTRMPMPRPPPQTFNSDYGTDYNTGPRHLNVHPPPRTMSNSPVMGYSDPAGLSMPQSHFPYRNPAAMRSAPGLSTPSHPHGPPHPHHAGPSHPHGPPRVHPSMMNRPPYAGPQYSRPGYPPYVPMQHPGHTGHRGPPQPPPSLAPMAHQIFHNAARMARQLPQRTDTPMTDISPPSSDPPSSGTAPSGSSPPTPRDHTTIQVAVDPAFIDPALADLPDSSSEPMLPHQYLRYAEGLVDKDIEEEDVEAAYPSVPPSGFVQRVKATLESKAAVEAAARNEAERDKSAQKLPIEEEFGGLEMEPDEEEIHELAVNETPRFTVIEEFEAPVELPASPVRLPELGGSPVQPKRRITREMVKAGLGPSDSVDETIVHTEIEDNTSIDVVVHQHKANRSREEVKETASVSENYPAVDDAPSTPVAANKKRPEDTGSDSVTTSSPEALGLSAVDYAVRFTGHGDSTTTSEETQSKDPFVLDADTITLQHQRSKDRVDKRQHLRDCNNTAVSEPGTEDESPVSLILPGEDNSRVSAVSPLQTQTLGIDETLRMASEPAPEDTRTTTDELSMSGAFPDEAQQPPTPRTPKSHSKSVQLRPSETLTDTSSSNRFSLPPDLSTVGDTTMNTTSNMLTDVAVRFSLPQTTITVSRPQIIEIPPSSSPEKPAERPASKYTKSALHATDSKSKRSSVTFADEIAPLKINKKLEQYFSKQKTADERSSKGKSIVRRPSPLQDSVENSRASRDSTTDLRFSGINAINNRFGSTHLPGLKEESVEDMSISDKHKSDMSQFPLPARIAAVKAMQERRLHESAEKAKARRAARHGNRPLAETRDLPSLNFSRMDLIDKLNEALEVRSSKSMEIIRRREFSGIYCPSPQRPQSTEPLRERYISFFSKPEDFSTFFDDPKDSDEEDETETEEVGVPTSDNGVPVVEVQPNTEVDIEEAVSRPLSPEDFLTVATQVNRLSIPSVSGLSDRLSELLPNLHDLQLDNVLASFSEISDDLRRLGDGIRPDTVLSTRTSAGFRTLAERAEEIVNNGTHDSIVPMVKLLGTNKELPALPESMSADKVSAVASIDGKQSYLSGSVSAPSDLGKEPARPPSALTRHKSPISEQEVQSLLPPEMNPIARDQKRAMIISSASSRPWNQDENYPWAGTKVDVDLTVPSQAHTRDSTITDVLSRRKTKSLELTSSGESTNTSKGIDIGSLIDHDASLSVTSEQLTGVCNDHLRKQSKRSVIGSITRKIGFGGNSTIRSLPSPVRQSLAAGESNGPHRPGERYPTSGLTPPTAFNLDEVRSFFSDDSSEKEHNASFRKCLTHFKGKGKGVRLTTPSGARSQDPSRSHSLDANTAYDSGAMTMSVERAGATSSANTYDGVGMGRTEFRIKRFGEKLRHLIAKSGELIRSWSTRSKQPRMGAERERVREDWLSDSVYSGV